jgi:hypothetical protein
LRKYVVAALAVLVVATGMFVGIRWLVVRDDPTQPATAQALAAAAHRHMPAEAKLVRVREGMGDPTERFVVRLEYEISGRSVSFSLEPGNQLPWLGEYGCASRADSPHDSPSPCEIRTLADGTKAAVAHLEGDRPATGVSVKRADQVVSVWVWPSAGVSDLPVSFEVLADMATDPLIGLKTSRQMLQLGKDIEVFPMS